jgi:predicted DNA binding CopG/RHH family protein
MAKKRELIIPKFGTESEDARWHHQHKRQLESAVGRRIKEGSTLTLKQAAARTELRPVTIRLPREDIATARGLAAEKGLRYQTYIKLLLREALQREVRSR